MMDKLIPLAVCGFFALVFILLLKMIHTDCDSDGGGIRGLSELLILQAIMRRVQTVLGLAETPCPAEYFDLIGGTSTGGYV